MKPLIFSGFFICPKSGYVQSDIVTHYLHFLLQFSWQLGAYCILFHIQHII